jgi:hypothetical protein
LGLKKHSGSIKNMTPDPNLMSDLIQSSSNLLAETVEKIEPTSTYSKASYYTTLGVYVLSFPGLWSQIKRSTKAKLKRKTYIRYVLFQVMGTKHITGIGSSNQLLLVLK